MAPILGRAAHIPRVETVVCIALPALVIDTDMPVQPVPKLAGPVAQHFVFQTFVCLDVYRANIVDHEKALCDLLRGTQRMVGQVKNVSFVRVWFVPVGRADGDMGRMCRACARGARIPRPAPARGARGARMCRLAAEPPDTRKMTKTAGWVVRRTRVAP